MSEERTTQASEPGADGAPDEEATVAALMSLAGQRADIPEMIERRVRASVENEWRRATAPRRTARWAAPLAMAATVLLALTVFLRAPEVAPTPAGTVARVSDPASGLGAGDRLYVGDTVATSTSGGVSFSLADETSVRLAPGSRLSIDGNDAFTLMAGMVYIDTGAPGGALTQVRVSTDFGDVTDIGTQFAVSLDASSMQVAVREGRVDIATGRQVVAAVAGRRVTVDRSAAVQTDTISAVDADWDWAEELAPRFDIDGKSVLDFLSWVARETGMELEFADDSDRAAADSARLYGSIDDLTPMEALASVMPTTSFDYLIDGDAISVRR